MKLLQHESPITYVQDITTPLIDPSMAKTIAGRVLYKERCCGIAALRCSGVRWNMCVIPVQHMRSPEAEKTEQRIDQMLRTYEFFSKDGAWGNEMLS